MPTGNNSDKRQAQEALRAHREAHQAAQESGFAADMRTFPDIHDESLSSLGDFSSRLMSRLHLAFGRDVYVRMLDDRGAFLLRGAVDDIADLMALAEAPSEDCAPAHEIARKQLAAVDRRMIILAQLREELVRMADADDPGHAGKCRVIEVLGDHRLCIGAHEQPDGSAVSSGS